jgi:hypothetical protein
MKTAYVLAMDKKHAERLRVISSVETPEEEFKRMCRVLKDLNVTTPNHKQKLFRLKLSAQEVRI